MKMAASVYYTRDQLLAKRADILAKLDMSEEDFLEKVRSGERLTYDEWLINEELEEIDDLLG